MDNGHERPPLAVQDSHGHGIDETVDQNGGPDGIGFFIGPAQGDACRQILHGAQQCRQPAYLPHVLPDVDGGKDQRGDGVGGDAAFLVEIPENQAAEQRFLHQGSQQDRTDGDQPGMGQAVRGSGGCSLSDRGPALRSGWRGDRGTGYTSPAGAPAARSLRQPLSAF